MAKRRKDDGPDGRLYFRSERIMQEQGRWYFLTRERTREGPFETRMDAPISGWRRWACSSESNSAAVPNSTSASDVCRGMAGAGLR